MHVKISASQSGLKDGTVGDRFNPADDNCSHGKIVMTDLVFFIGFSLFHLEIIRTSMKLPPERLSSLRCLPHGVVTVRR